MNRSKNTTLVDDFDMDNNIKIKIIDDIEFEKLIQNSQYISNTNIHENDDQNNDDAQNNNDNINDDNINDDDENDDFELDTNYDSNDITNNSKEHPQDTQNGGQNYIEKKYFRYKCLKYHLKYLALKYELKLYLPKNYKYINNYFNNN